MRSVAGSRQTVAALAARQRLEPRQEFADDELRRPGAGARRRRRRPDARRSRRGRRGRARRRCQRRIAVGDEHHARRDCRRPAASSAARSLAKSAGRSRSRMLLRLRRRWRSCRPGWNSTRSTPASMMTSATRPENLMSLAPTVSSTRSSLRPGALLRAASAARCSCGDLRRHRCRSRSASAGIRGRAASRSRPALDGRAGAGQRQEGDRDVRVLAPRARARRASDSRRASGGRPPTSSARRGAAHSLGVVGLAARGGRRRPCRR